MGFWSSGLTEPKNKCCKQTMEWFDASFYDCNTWNRSVYLHICWAERREKEKKNQLLWYLHLEMGIWKYSRCYLCLAWNWAGDKIQTIFICQAALKDTRTEPENKTTPKMLVWENINEDFFKKKTCNDFVDLFKMVQPDQRRGCSSVVEHEGMLKSRFFYIYSPANMHLAGQYGLLIDLQLFYDTACF